MYGLGAIRSAPDPRTYKYHPVAKQGIRAATVALPETYTTVPNLPSVRDQGSSSTCVAQTCACIAEYHARKENNFTGHCSPQFVYNNRSNYPGDGMFDIDAMNILKNLGICREPTFPFGSSAVKGSIPAAARNEALQFRTAAYAEVVFVNTDPTTSITNLKKAIMDNGPAYVSFPVYDYTGRFWYPGEPARPSLGGHAVAIVGWDTKGFIIRNSWGTDWANGGYTNYSYSDFAKRYHWDIYTTVDADSDDVIYPPDPEGKKCCDGCIVT